MRLAQRRRDLTVAALLTLVLEGLRTRAPALHAEITSNNP